MREIRPLIEQIESRGLLGQRILDVGSGSQPVGGAAYPVDGKRIVRMDIGAPERLRLMGNILQIQCDIENLGEDDIALALAHAGDGRLFSTILFLDILNYVDSAKTLEQFLGVLDSGGRMIVSNFQNMGIEDLFSDKRARTNSELAGIIQGLGLRIEHTWNPPLHPPWLPGAPAYTPPQYPSIMPTRDIGSMVVVAVNG